MKQWYCIKKNGKYLRGFDGPNPKWTEDKSKAIRYGERTAHDFSGAFPGCEVVEYAT